MNEQAESLSRQFLATFNRVESRLDFLGSTKRMPGNIRATFYALVADAAASNSVVRAYASELRDYADLRNAIVHDATGLPIAEPHLRTVERLDQILRELTAPTKLYPKFNLVEWCRPDEEIGAVASRMRDGRFSQMPVVNGSGIQGLLTGETIARWMASQLEAHEFLISEKVSLVMRHTEDIDNYVLLGKAKTLYDAKERFDDHHQRGKSLDAIIVTESGRPSDKPLGIITIFDYPLLTTPADRASPSSP